MGVDEKAGGNKVKKRKIVVELVQNDAVNLRVISQAIAKQIKERGLINE